MTQFDPVELPVVEEDVDDGPPHFVLEVHDSTLGASSVFGTD